MNFVDLIVIGVCASLGLAFAAFWFWPLRSPSPAFEADDKTSLLFENGVLHHGSEAALYQFSFQVGLQEWQDLRDQVKGRFPTFPTWHQAQDAAFCEYISNDPTNPGKVVIARQGTRTSVTFFDASDLEGMEEPLAPEHLQELAVLKEVSSCAPSPVWKTDEQGRVIWRNAAYEVLFRQVKPRSLDTTVPFIELTHSPEPQRVALPTIQSDQPDWFSVVGHKVADGTIFHASCVNEVVMAEKTQANFVQTLAKTFAHLSIGLAIFGRDRQLVLFNPALLDLTALPVEFLSSKPTMESFFDLLRENRKMPEPKNYHNWRQELADVIKAAKDGRYQETWSLESGQTYRVSGRPHPDGATAFLIEDISAEVLLTRNFRAELEQGQYLLDMLDDGLAVFSPTGVLTFSNATYNDMWGVKPEATFADITIADSIKTWKSKSDPNPMWQEIEDFVLNYGDRHTWDVPLRIRNQPPMACQVVPILSGATMMRFRIQPQTQKHPIRSLPNTP